MAYAIKFIPQSEMDKLLVYDWPANVRELEHYIERSVIFTDRNSSTLRLPEIPSVHHQGTTKAQFLPLAKVEKEHIEKVLSATGWKVSSSGGAALILGLNPNPA